MKIFCYHLQSEDACVETGKCILVCVCVCVCACMYQCQYCVDVYSTPASYYVLRCLKGYWCHISNTVYIKAREQKCSFNVIIHNIPNQY